MNPGRNLGQVVVGPFAPITPPEVMLTAPPDAGFGVPEEQLNSRIPCVVKETLADWLGFCSANVDGRVVLGHSGTSAEAP